MLDADFGCWTAAEWRCQMEECWKSLEMPAERKMPEEPGDARRAKCRKSLEMPKEPGDAGRCLEMLEERGDAGRAWRCRKMPEDDGDAGRCLEMLGDVGRARML